MNENLRVGEQFFRIIREFEKAPPDCKQTEDGAALEAYLCPSNQWTLGFGCCFWHYDGRPVKEGDTLDPSQVGVMLAYNARYCEDYVRACVAVELTQNQFDALCSFRFNTRETTLRNSSRLLPSVNAQEWQKAAVAFTEFVYGSSLFDGKPYQEAMRGLLRRRLWESLIFLGLDPTEAVKDKDVALPSDRVLLSSGVYRDRIRSEGLTTVNQVKMKAPPLASELVLNTPAPPLATTRVPDGKAEQPGADPQSQPPAVSAPKVSPAPSDRVVPPVVAPRKPEANLPAPPAVSPRAPVPAPLPTPVGTKPPSVNTKMPEHVPYRIDPQAGLKPMEETERFVGAALMLFGTFARVIMANTTAVTGVGGVLVVGILDMMKSPTNLAILITVITMGITAVLWVLAFIIDKLGLKIKKRGEKSATQAMF